jgi:hypothetical protein
MCDPFILLPEWRDFSFDDDIVNATAVARRAAPRYVVGLPGHRLPWRGHPALVGAWAQCHRISKVRPGPPAAAHMYKGSAGGTIHEL